MMELGAFRPAEIASLDGVQLLLKLLVRVVDIVLLMPLGEAMRCIERVRGVSSEEDIHLPFRLTLASAARLQGLRRHRAVLGHGVDRYRRQLVCRTGGEVGA